MSHYNTLSFLQPNDTAGCTIRTRWKLRHLSLPLGHGVEPRLVTPGVYCGSRFLSALHAGLRLPGISLYTYLQRLYLSFIDGTLRLVPLTSLQQLFTFKAPFGLFFRPSFSALLHLDHLAQIQQTIQHAYAILHHNAAGSCGLRCSSRA